jgi:acetolactate synthase-1/2/3 large subunit
LQAAFQVDGPSVVAVECSADENPPFANFLGQAAVKQPVITEENQSNVVARA